MTDKTIDVEVVYASVDQQKQIELRLPYGATVEQAILASKITDQFAEIDLASCSVGIFSQKVSLEAEVQSGDRIEIYRPLTQDPKMRRRNKLKASQNRTSGA